MLHHFTFWHVNVCVCAFIAAGCHVWNTECSLCDINDDLVTFLQLIGSLNGRGNYQLHFLLASVLPCWGLLYPAAVDSPSPDSYYYNFTTLVFIIIIIEHICLGIVAVGYKTPRCEAASLFSVPYLFFVLQLASLSLVTWQLWNCHVLLWQWTVTVGPAYFLLVPSAYQSS